MVSCSASARVKVPFNAPEIRSINDGILCIRSGQPLFCAKVSNACIINAFFWSDVKLEFCEDSSTFIRSIQTFNTLKGVSGFPPREVCMACESPANCKFKLAQFAHAGDAGTTGLFAGTTGTITDGPVLPVPELLDDGPDDIYSVKTKMNF